MADKVEKVLTFNITPAVKAIEALTRKVEALGENIDAQLKQQTTTTKGMYKKILERAKRTHRELEIREKGHQDRLTLQKRKKNQKEIIMDKMRLANLKHMHKTAEAHIKAYYKRIAKHAGATAQFVKYVWRRAMATLSFYLVMRFAPALVQSFIEPSRQLEIFTLQFKTLYKSAEEARKVMEKLTEFAIITPFELPDVISAFRTLRIYGIESKEMLQAVGDAAAGVGAELSEVARWVGRLATGVTGRPLWRLAEMGILTRQMLEMRGLEFAPSGEYIGEIQKLVDTVEELMRDRFGGFMEEAAETFNGIYTNIQDTFWKIRIIVSRPLFTRLKKELKEFYDYLDTSIRTGSVAQFTILVDKYTNQILDIIKDRVPKIIEALSSAQPYLTRLFDIVLKFVTFILKNLWIIQSGVIATFLLTMIGLVNRLALSIKNLIATINMGQMTVGGWVLLLAKIAAVIASLVLPSLLKFKDSLGLSMELMEKWSKLSLEELRIQFVEAKQKYDELVNKEKELKDAIEERASAVKEVAEETKKAYTGTQPPSVGAAKSEAVAQLVMTSKETEAIKGSEEETLETSKESSKTLQDRLKTTKQMRKELEGQIRNLETLIDLRVGSAEATLSEGRLSERLVTLTEEMKRKIEDITIRRIELEKATAKTVEDRIEKEIALKEAQLKKEFIGVRGALIAQHKENIKWEIIKQKAREAGLLDEKDNWKELSTEQKAIRQEIMADVAAMYEKIQEDAEDAADAELLELKNLQKEYQAFYEEMVRRREKLGLFDLKIEEAKASYEQALEYDTQYIEDRRDLLIAALEEERNYLKEQLETSDKIGDKERLRLRTKLIRLNMEISRLTTYNLTNMIKSVNSVITQGFANAFNAALYEAQGFQEQMKALWQNLVATLIAELTKLVIKLIGIQVLLKAIFSFLGLGGIGGFIETGGIFGALLGKGKVEGQQRGGIIHKGEVGFFEGYGTEIVAPKKDFIKVAKELVTKEVLPESEGYPGSVVVNNDFSKSFITMDEATVSDKLFRLFLKGQKRAQRKLGFATVRGVL